MGFHVSYLFFPSFFLFQLFNLQHVLGLNDKAPARPDQTGAHEREVLRKGQLLSRSSKVGNTRQDKSPLLEGFGVSQLFIHGYTYTHPINIWHIYEDKGKSGKPHLHDRRPKVHRLDANLALPRLLEPARRLLLLSGSRALPSLALLAELLAEELLVLAGEEGGRSGGALAEDGPGGTQNVARRGHGL